MFRSIGNPMLLSTRTANSLLSRKKGLGTFNAEMIIATVHQNEIGEEEMDRAAGGDDGGGSGGASKKRRRN